MGTEYAPQWLTGAEALDQLARAGHDGQAGFILLQAAIRDGEVAARARGRDRERQARINWGLCRDHDFVEQVDGPWRNKFTYADPTTVDIGAFSAESEVLRADMLRCFPPETSLADGKMSKPKATSGRPGRKKGDGTIDDGRWLGLMRSSIDRKEAKSPHEAATKVVDQHARKIGGISRDAKIARLRRKFSSKHHGVDSNPFKSD